MHEATSVIQSHTFHRSLHSIHTINPEKDPDEMPREKHPAKTLDWPTPIHSMRDCDRDPWMDCIQILVAVLIRGMRGSTGTFLSSGLLLITDNTRIVSITRCKISTRWTGRSCCATFKGLPTLHYITYMCRKPQWRKSGLIFRDSSVDESQFNRIRILQFPPLLPQSHRPIEDFGTGFRHGRFGGSCRPEFQSSNTQRPNNPTMQQTPTHLTTNNDTTDGRKKNQQRILFAIPASTPACTCVLAPS